MFAVYLVHKKSIYPRLFGGRRGAANCTQVRMITQMKQCDARTGQSIFCRRDQQSILED